MTRDLHSRLRRAAEQLDEQAVARMSQNSGSSTASAPTGRPTTRRWLAAAAAACLVLVGLGTLMITADGGSSDDDLPPAGPTTTSPPVDEGLLQPGWNELPEAPIGDRYAHLTVPTETGIFVWGGLDDPDALFGIQSRPPLEDGAHLDLTTGTWQQAPPFPIEGTTGIATGALVAGRVVVLTQPAGSGDEGWYGDSEVVAAAYDPQSNTWEELPDPPIGGPIFRGPNPLFAVGDLAVFVEPSDPDGDSATSCIVAVDPDGEENGNECEDQSAEVTTDVTTKVAIFDPATGEWRQGTPPPVEIYDATWGTEVGDRILVAAPPGDDVADACNAPLYLYTPATDEWERFSDGPDEALAIAGLTWTGDSLFAATPDVCHGAELDVAADAGSRDAVVDGTLGHEASEDMPDPLGRLTTLDGEHSSFDAPSYIASIEGWWTGSSVAMMNDGGLPTFYRVETGTWHEAPLHEALSAPGNVGDRGYWRGIEMVWSQGAMVFWAGADLPDLSDASDDPASREAMAVTPRGGGLAYVPPDEFRSK